MTVKLAVPDDTEATVTVVMPIGGLRYIAKDLQNAPAGRSGWTHALLTAIAQAVRVADAAYDAELKS